MSGIKSKVGSSSKILDELAAELIHNKLKLMEEKQQRKHLKFSK